eukprot:SAG31_NODE_24163_length_487_cov_6.981959_1_plen_100_part_01
MLKNVLKKSSRFNISPRSRYIILSNPGIKIRAILGPAVFKYGYVIGIHTILARPISCALRARAGPQQLPAPPPPPPPTAAAPPWPMAERRFFGPTTTAQA